MRQFIEVTITPQDSKDQIYNKLLDLINGTKQNYYAKLALLGDLDISNIKSQKALKQLLTTTSQLIELELTPLSKKLFKLVLNCLNDRDQLMNMQSLHRLTLSGFDQNKNTIESQSQYHALLDTLTKTNINQVNIAPLQDDQWLYDAAYQLTHNVDYLIVNNQAWVSASMALGDKKLDKSIQQVRTKILQPEQTYYYSPYQNTNIPTQQTQYPIVNTYCFTLEPFFSATSTAQSQFNPTRSPQSTETKQLPWFYTNHKHKRRSHHGLPISNQNKQRRLNTNEPQRINSTHNQSQNNLTFNGQQTQSSSNTHNHNSGFYCTYFKATNARNPVEVKQISGQWDGSRRNLKSPIHVEFDSRSFNNSENAQNRQPNPQQASSQTNQGLFLGASNSTSSFNKIVSINHGNSNQGNNLSNNGQPLRYMMFSGPNQHYYEAHHFYYNHGP